MLFPPPPRERRPRAATTIAGMLLGFAVGVSAMAHLTGGTAPGLASVGTFDEYGRLVDYPGKLEIPCPAQTERTAVILALGQSNIANETGQRRRSAFADRVAALFAGRCTEAASPLLGATGAQGEPLTLLGNALMESGRYDRVVLVPAAIGGSAIARWAHGDLTPLLQSVVTAATARYRVTHVLWHQGESDAQTDAATYAAAFHRVAETLRSAGTDAPIFVSVTTRCTGLNPHWRPDNAVARAQAALPDAARNIRAGVDTDRLLDPLDRFDDCHLGASGQEKFVAALVPLLVSAEPHIRAAAGATD